MKKKYIYPTIDSCEYDLTLSVLVESGDVDTGDPDDWGDARRRGIVDDDSNDRNKTYGSRGSRGKGWGSLW